MNRKEEKPFTKFTDEFGEIDREVFDAAVALLPRVESYAQRTLGDAAAGQRLLMKACASVTRRRQAGEDLANLTGYLYRTWQRLLLAELEKANGHRRLESALAAEAPRHTTENLDRRILLQQVIQHMDDWTRRVFEYLALDYSYEQIAKEIGGNGHAIRMKYDRKLQALAQQLNAGKGGA
jgi:DNA-directed RNA polymerase specialized sigma24 family protein